MANTMLRPLGVMIRNVLHLKPQQQKRLVEEPREDTHNERMHQRENDEKQPAATASTRSNNSSDCHQPQQLAIWEAGNVPEHWIGLESELEEFVMSLSGTDASFLLDAATRERDPSGQCFEFNMNDAETRQTIRCMMLRDSRLELRYRTLVPTVVSEEAFWRSYFYLVHVIKSSKRVHVLPQFLSTMQLKAMQSRYVDAAAAETGKQQTAMSRNSAVVATIANNKAIVQLSKLKTNQSKRRIGSINVGDNRENILVAQCPSPAIATTPIDYDIDNVPPSSSSLPSDDDDNDEYITSGDEYNSELRCNRNGSGPQQRSLTSSDSTISVNSSLNGSLDSLSELEIEITPSQNRSTRRSAGSRRKNGTGIVHRKRHQNLHQFSEQEQQQLQPPQSQQSQLQPQPTTIPKDQHHDMVILLSNNKKRTALASATSHESLSAMTGGPMFSLKRIPSSGSIASSKKHRTGFAAHGTHSTSTKTLSMTPTTHSSAASCGTYIPELLQSKRPHDKSFTTTAQRCLIYSYLPFRLRLKPWRLLYSTREHGTSMRTLLSHGTMMEEVLLLVQTVCGTVMGAFISEELLCESHYYGSGECFVFHFSTGSLTKSQTKIHVFKWAKKNTFFVRSTEHGGISIGGDDQGRCSLRIESDLLTGSSQPCDTFDNPCLNRTHVDQEPVHESYDHEQFEILNVEVWGFGKAVT